MSDQAEVSNLKNQIGIKESPNVTLVSEEENKIPAHSIILAHPYPREKFRPKKSTKKCILRNFICHLDRHFLKFLAISVGNQQRTETTNPLQIDTF